MPRDFLDALFGFALVACAVAQWLILRGVLRSAPDRTASPTVRAPHRGGEIFWAVLPAFLLAATFYLAWRTMHPS